MAVDRSVIEDVKVDRSGLAGNSDLVYANSNMGVQTQLTRERSSEDDT